MMKGERKGVVFWYNSGVLFTLGEHMRTKTCTKTKLIGATQLVVVAQGGSKVMGVRLACYFYCSKAKSGGLMRLFASLRFSKTPFPSPKDFSVVGAVVLIQREKEGLP